MHFKLDENIPLALERFLKNKGRSVSTVFSERISGIDDIKLLELCNREKFILVTQDKDFLHMHPQNISCGMILLRLKSQGIHSVIDAFERLIKSMPLERSQNSFIIIEDSNIRVRSIG